MGHKIALAASAAVAAFVIVLLGAVGTYVLLKSPQANAGLAAPAAGQVTNQQAQLPPSPDGFGQSSANSSSGETNNGNNGTDGTNGSSGQANGNEADPAGYAVSADQAAAI